jgi:rhodanese-related sulfurtransferase
MAGIDMVNTRRARAYKALSTPGGATPSVAQAGRLVTPWRQALPATLFAAQLLVGCGPGTSAHEFEEHRARYDARQVAAYCTIGWSSGVYAAKLRRNDVEAFNLVSGVIGWAHAGGEFADSNGSTRNIHVYGISWDLAPAGSATVW